MRNIFAVFTFALLLNMVSGRSGGAPNEACPNVTPNPAMHGAAAQAGASPFTLTVQGSPTEYVPGQQYTCK